MARNERIRRTFTPQFKKDAVALLKEGRSAQRRRPQPRHRAKSASTLEGPARSQATAGSVPRLGQSHAGCSGGRRAPQEAPPRDRGARHPEKSAGLLRGRRELRFRFMDAHRGEFRIGTMCEVLGVSRSGYYAWRRRPRSPRDETNAQLTQTIRRHPPGEPTGSTARRGSTRPCAAVASRADATAWLDSCATRGSARRRSGAFGAGGRDTSPLRGHPLLRTSR